MSSMTPTFCWTLVGGGTAEPTGKAASVLCPGPALRPLGEDLVLRPARVAAKLFEGPEAKALKERPIWLVGDGVKKYEETLAPEFGPAAKIYPYESGDIRLEVARLGLRRFLAAGGQSPDDVEPHYVRRPDARPPAADFLSDPI